jgi:hypothetical protein
MKPYRSQKSPLRILLLFATVLLFASPTKASRSAPFAPEGFEGPWTNPAPYWKPIIGSWELKTVDGSTVLTSTAVKPETGLPNTSYAFLNLDSAHMHGTEFVFKFRIPEVVPPPEINSAAFYISFALDAPVGSHPETIFTVTGNPVRDLENTSGTIFRFWLTGEAPEEEEKSQADIASEISTEEWLSLRIKVDSQNNTVVAGFDGLAESEPVVLSLPWSDVRFIRIYQRGIALEMKPVENLE